MRTTTNYNLNVPELIDKVKDSITAYGLNFEQLDEIIHNITGLRFELVQSLPASGENGIIYLVPSATTETQNIYDEFIWVNNDFEQIGTTAVDLTNYYTKSETDTLLNNKQGILTAGNNISITGNTVGVVGETIKEITDSSIRIWNMEAR